MRSIGMLSAKGGRGPWRARNGQTPAWCPPTNAAAPWSRNLLSRSFAPLLSEAGIPHVRFHDLRHTAATLVAAQDVHTKVVSETLGHASVGITLDQYSHVTPSMAQQAVTAM
jgi:integrase